MTKDTDGYLAPNNPKSCLWNGWVTKDANGCLGPKILLSPTYGVDRSSRTPTGALIMKFMKSYLQGGRTIKNANGCLCLKNFVNSYLQGGQITKDIDGCLRPKIIKSYLQAQIILSPTYEKDKRLKVSIGGWMTKDTDRYLVTDIHVSYLRSGWTSKNIHGYAITQQ